MEGRTIRPAVEHMKTIGWVLLLIYVFLGLFAWISGRIVGYSLAVWVCAGLAAIVTIVFVFILLMNLVIVGGISGMKRLFRRHR